VTGRGEFSLFGPVVVDEGQIREGLSWQNVQMI
jgi:hypothetical protein